MVGLTRDKGLTVLESAKSVLRWLDAIAKLRFCPPSTIMKEIPITSPRVLRTGPPLLPGEIGAVICRRPLAGPPRLLLIMPSENVPSKPFGLPAT